MRSKVDWFARLPAQARSPRSELSSPGRRADLYSAFSVQRKLEDLRKKRPRTAFSATDSRRDSARNAAKCDVFGVRTRYFPDNEDLLAEGARFEVPVQFRTAKFRHVRKLQIPVLTRESRRQTQAQTVRFGPVPIRLPLACSGEEQAIPELQFGAVKWCRDS